MKCLIIALSLVGLSSCCNNDNDKPSCPDLMEWKDGDCRCPDTYIEINNKCIEKKDSRYVLDTSYCDCINEFIIEFIGEPKEDLIGHYTVQDYGINTLDGGDQGGKATVYPFLDGDSLVIGPLHELEILDFCIIGGPWYAIYMKRNKALGTMKCKIVSSEDLYNKIRQDSCTFIMKNK